MLLEQRHDEIRPGKTRGRKRQAKRLPPEPGRRLVCAACGNPVTTESARMERAGSHRHIFMNPHGMIFEIGCFSAVEGCGCLGSPALEHTWFPGCAWQIAFCLACRTHLGWRFSVENGSVFWGLILPHLRPET